MTTPAAPDARVDAPATTHPRHRYSARVKEVSTGPGMWNTALVTVVEHATDANDERVVGTYERGLAAMYDTFHPFRQYREGRWHDYALISADYTRVSVMDLSTGDIVAVEQPTAADLDAATKLIAENPDRYAGKTPADVSAAWGFCPTQFHVIDWWDEDASAGRPTSWRHGAEHVTGQFALYTGCVWGDDSSWKIQYIDLSRLSEGVIACDARFGYLELPAGVALSDAVSYWPEEDRLEIAVSVPFNRTTGTADTDVRDAIAWSDTPPTSS